MLALSVQKLAIFDQQRRCAGFGHGAAPSHAGSIRVPKAVRVTVVHVELLAVR